MGRLILGAATSYGLDQILPFARSLRRAGYRGHVALFVSTLEPEAQEVLRGMDVELVEVAGGWQTLSRRQQRLRRHAARIRLPTLWYAASLGWVVGDPVGRRLRRNRLAAPFHHISSARYFLYYDYFLRHHGAFDSVMLTDVRDVLFQDDPFTFPQPQPLLFFLEGSQQRIGTEPYNRQWMLRLYGRRALRSFGGQRIVCSGITIGRADAVLRYLELVCDELARLSSRIGGRVGCDQGVHNYLVWSKRFPESALLENGRGPVLTMGIEAPERFRNVANGWLLNDDGSRVAVVHQYDRHERCAKSLLQRLAGT
jgi:hypothetical protein